MGNNVNPAVQLSDLIWKAKIYADPGEVYCGIHSLYNLFGFSYKFHGATNKLPVCQANIILLNDLIRTLASHDGNCSIAIEDTNSPSSDMRIMNILVSCYLVFMDKLHDIPYHYVNKIIKDIDHMAMAINDDLCIHQVIEWLRKDPRSNEYRFPVMDTCILNTLLGMLSIDYHVTERVSNAPEGDGTLIDIVPCIIRDIKPEFVFGNNTITTTKKKYLE